MPAFPNSLNKATPNKRLRSTFCTQAVTDQPAALLTRSTLDRKGLLPKRRFHRHRLGQRMLRLKARAVALLVAPLPEASNKEFAVSAARSYLVMRSLFMTLFYSDKNYCLKSSNGMSINCRFGSATDSGVLEEELFTNV